MKLSAPALAALHLDDDLRAAIDRARAVTSPGARRRAERGLAGELRRADLADVERRLAGADSGGAEARVFKLAEGWRARLIAEGPAAAASFPGGTDDALPDLIKNAQRERDTGRPRGAARALFRHLFARLQARDAEPAE
jgi:ribosome-associated protein